MRTITWSKPFFQQLSRRDAIISRVADSPSTCNTVLAYPSECTNSVHALSDIIQVSRSLLLHHGCTRRSTRTSVLALHFVNAEASLNQRLLGNDPAPHVCHCEANVDSWRVLLIAQFQKQILGFTRTEGLTARGAQVTQQFRSELWIGGSGANQGVQMCVIA